jgi:hypothetical protein
MVLRFVNNMQKRVLTTYHIIMQFKTIERNPSCYRLEVLAELRDEIELGCLTTQLGDQIRKRFAEYQVYSKELKTLYERQRIEQNFNNKINDYVYMKFVFMKWIHNEFGRIINVIDRTDFPDGVKDYRVNILKTGTLPFSMYNDIFVIEIDTTGFR